METKFDEETGFPVLPGGYYWKVGPREGRNTSYGTTYRGYGASLRKDGFFGGVESRTQRIITRPGNLHYALVDAMVPLVQRLERKLEQERAEQELAGNYRKPKRLTSKD